MRGVKFGSYHTADNWGLILNDKTLTPPEPKSVYVKVDGRDGDLDLSEALTGEIKYNNREASFTFILADGTYQERESLISQILGAVHGRKLKIILPDDQTHYLLGRCKVSERFNDRAYGRISIVCNCEPWLYAVTETARSISISQSTNIVLSNQGIKTVVPEITVTGDITLQYNNSTVALTTGSYKLTSLKLKTGNNTIVADGSGDIVFKYREGVL